MAFSNVKVCFEIGHEASIKSKRTFEGFTHDWEVFVRGADNTDISHFVEKVVFHLHSTFPKPKRVVKEPPYSVKEKGWAGFTLPIDIYFKNLDEPKKVHYEYDLQLQPNGPSIIKSRREKFTFPNPPEDLRRRLIRGGGVGTSDNEGSRFAPSPEKALELDSPLKLATPLVGKPKLGADSCVVSKKLKGKDDPPRGNDEFSDLFGTPIHTNSKASPDPKKSSSSSSKTVEKSTSDKHSSASKSSKHIPQKEVKDKGGSKEESKERSKDKEKSRPKDKSLKHSSGPIKRPQSPKRPVTPPKRSVTPSKRPASPQHKRPTTPQLKDDIKKKTDETKAKNDSKSSDGKSEKRKKDKKSSKEEKSKKVKLKGHEKKREDKEVLGNTEKSSKDKEKKIVETKEISRKETDKPQGKHNEYDKDHEKLKHKHKKKEKNKQDNGEKDRSNERGKSSKKVLDKIDDSKDKERNGVGIELSDGSKKKRRSESLSPINISPVKQSVPPDKATSSKDKPVKNPLTMLFDELIDHESSNSNNSPSEEEEDSEPHAPVLPKKSRSSDDSNLSSSAKATQSIESVVNSYERSPVNNKAHSSKPQAAALDDYSALKQSDKQKSKSETKKKKEKKESGVKSSTKEKDKGDKDTAKRMRKTSLTDDSKADYEPPKKISKDVKETTRMEDAPAIVRSSVLVDDEADKSLYEAPVTEAVDEEAKPVSAINERFTADYVAQLKDLQQKIMTLDDNTELQRVVQLIAETGHYEITKKTFDFDLCELDQMTVKRLQDFFVAS